MNEVTAVVKRYRERQAQRRRARLGPPLGRGETLQREWERLTSDSQFVTRLEQSVEFSMGIDSVSMALVFAVYRATFNARLNNSLQPICARWLLKNYPELQGKIKLREMTRNTYIEED